MKQRAFLRLSSHLIDKMHSQWSADLTLFLSGVEDVGRALFLSGVENVGRALFRGRGRLKDDERADRMSESEAKKMKRDDNTNEKKKSWNQF